MNILFINWSTAIILASITMFSPLALNKSAKVSPVMETEVAPKGCATNFENQGLIPFHFDPLLSPTKANIEEEDNWKPGPNPEADCDGDNVLACGLLVNSQYVDDSDPSELKLDPSILLTAKEQTNPLADTYVESILQGAGQIFNKSM